MDKSDQTLQKLHLHLSRVIKEPFEFYVLSQSFDSGTFLLVSPTFTYLDLEMRELWLVREVEEALGEDFDCWLGNTLCPNELSKVSQYVPIESSLYQSVSFSA